MAAFDIDGARASGASDSQIADYLASKTGVDVGAMRKDGLPDSQIAEFLVRSMQGPARMAAPAPEAANNTVGDDGILNFVIDNIRGQRQEKPPEEASFGSNFLNGLRLAGPQVMNGVSNVINRLAAKDPEMLAASRRPDVNAWNSRVEAQDARLRSEADALKKENAPLLNSWGGFLGNITGNAGASAAMMAPLAMIPGANTYAGAAALGGLSGAMQPLGTDESRASNVGLGAVGGAAGRAIGQGLQWAGNALLRPGASSMTPERAANVLRVRAEMPFEPIPMNAAQMTGDNMSRRVLDAAQSMPFLSGARDAANTQTREAVNRAISRHIGENTTNLTDHVLAGAQQRIGSVFDRIASPNRTVNMDVKPMADKMIEAWKRYDEPLLRSLQNTKVEKLLRETGDLMVTNGGKVPANRVQRTISELGDMASDAFSSNSPQKTQLGKMLRDLQEGMLDAMQAGLPRAEQRAFQNARREYAILSILKDNPGIRDAEGNVSIKLLDNALARSNKAAYMTGGNDIASLTKALRGTVGETLPTSGTAERAQMQRLMNGGTITGLGVAGAVSPGLTAIPAAALGASYGVVKNMQRQGVQNALARVAAQGGGAAMRQSVGSAALQNALARGGAGLSLATPQAMTIQQLVNDQR